MTTRTKRPARPRPFDVRRSSIHGTGGFANRRIRKGERIIEYRGQRITQREADRRYPDDDDGSDHHTFLFEVDDRTVVDAGVRGNPARWINHSCDPNCESVIEDGRVWIEAMRNIRPGEELTYDYQFTLEERHTPAAKKLYPCYCGSRKCRGTILIPKREMK